MIIQHAERTVLMTAVTPVSHGLRVLAPVQVSGSPGRVSGPPEDFSVLSEKLHTGKHLGFEESSHTGYVFSLKNQKRGHEALLQGPTC